MHRRSRGAGSGTNCGASGWRWETVLPYFKKIERDIDLAGSSSKK